MLVVAVLGDRFGIRPAMSEELDCSFSKKSKQEISSQAIRSGDRPDHEMVQFVRVDAVSSKNPEFDGTDQTTYVHSDQIAGTGSHAGYGAVTLPSGERLWFAVEGPQAFIPQGGEAWQLPYLGVSRLIAATSKYKAIRGAGHYRGVVTSAGMTDAFVCEAEY